MSVNTLKLSGGRLAVAFLAALSLSPPVLGQPHAEVPILIPQFSIDLASPTEGSPVPASAILGKPGPTPAYWGAGLGLPNPEDELDDFSYNRLTAAQSASQFLLLFGVDRASVGAALPDSTLAASGRIFNVTDQASRHQAAADLYESLDGFTLNGTPAPKGRTHRSKYNNTLVANQGDSGGVDQDLSPANAPVQQTAPSQDLDDGDAIAYPTGGTGSLRNPTIFFTMSRYSPSLPNFPGIPGQQSGADVFRDSDLTIGGNEAPYVAADILGLAGTPLGDDIDALVVFDDGDNIFEPGVDAVLFSLARNSPALNQGPYSPADIFISRGYGVFSLFASAEDLGLAFNDNLDCLEIVPTNDPTGTVYGNAIFLVWPGDFDHNGLLNQTDCSAFLGCYGGSGLPYDADGSLAHEVMVGPSHAFNPGALVVQTGDSVHWTWVDGPHNVVSGTDSAADGIFFSGPPAFPVTAFSVLFDDAFLNLHPKGGAHYPYFSTTDVPFGMVGSITVQPHPCAVFDLDFDEDVDCEDWIAFQAVYAQANGGLQCSPLSLPDFVNALLGQPSHPAHVCFADINGDGNVDGVDVQAYVFAVLGP